MYLLLWLLDLLINLIPWNLMHLVKSHLMCLALVLLDRGCLVFQSDQFHTNEQTNPLHEVHPWTKDPPMNLSPRF